MMMLESMEPGDSFDTGVLKVVRTKTSIEVSDSEMPSRRFSIGDLKFIKNPRVNREIDQLIKEYKKSKSFRKAQVMTREYIKSIAEREEKARKTPDEPTGVPSYRDGHAGDSEAAVDAVRKTKPSDPKGNPRIKALKKIMKSGQAAVIDGKEIDLEMATRMLKAYNGMTAGEKKKYLSLSISFALSVASRDEHAKMSKKFADDKAAKRRLDMADRERRAAAVREMSKAISSGSIKSDMPAKMKKIKKIVDTHSMAKVDGVSIDATTANVLLTVYNALSDENKRKFASMNVKMMTQFAWGAVGKK